MKYEMVSVEQLKPYIEIDRSKFSEYVRYKMLKDGIIKDGVKFPVLLLVNSKSGKIHIADGNTRIAVAQELGIKNIPAVVVCYDRKGVENIHKLPPVPYLRKMKIGAIIKPSKLGFRKTHV